MSTKSFDHAKNEKAQSLSSKRTGILQRRCSDCPKKRRLLQRHSMSRNEPAAVPPIVHEVLLSPGKPLDRETREFMEPRFSHDFSRVRAHTATQAAELTVGSANDSYEQEANRVAESVMHAAPSQGAAHPPYDFSKVRVHSDSRAAESARAVNARAYTAGQNIVFGLGQYAPGTSEGRMLLAHELAHTAQQVNGMQRLMRKSFSCPDYAGDRKLEACLNDQDRLRPGDTGPSVRKVQRGLMKDGISVGLKRDDGIFGSDTGQGVMAFKKKHNLGYYQYPDVGPGTMSKLDELCSSGSVPPWTTPPQITPGGPSCQFTILYNNMRTVSAPSGTCGGAIQYDVVRVTAKGGSCPKTLEGLYLTERVRTDHGCGTPLDQTVKTGGPLGPIDSNGYLPSLSTDTYGMYIPPDLAPSCDSPCTETFDQKLYVGGRFAEENYISFEVCRIEGDCVTVIRRNGIFIGIV